MSNIEPTVDPRPDTAPVIAYERSVAAQGPRFVVLGRIARVCAFASTLLLGLIISLDDAPTDWLPNWASQMIGWLPLEISTLGFVFGVIAYFGSARRNKRALGPTLFNAMLTAGYVLIIALFYGASD